MPSDVELMGAVREGDAEALGVLFSRHHEAVYALSARLIQDDDLADDITQDVFLRVWRYARSFRGRSAFRTWLYRLAYNACLDRRRRDARWQESYDFDLTPADTSSAEPTDRHMLLEGPTKDHTTQHVAPHVMIYAPNMTARDLGFESASELADMAFMGLSKPGTPGNLLVVVPTSDH